MRIRLVALVLVLLTSCTSTEPISVSQDYIYCLDGDQQGSGFRSGDWLYTAEHVYNHQGLRELLGVDMVREPIRIIRATKTSIPYTKPPEKGTEVTLNGCDKYGSPLKGSISLISEDGATYGFSGDRIALIEVEGLTEAPGGFSGGPAQTPDGWFGIIMGYDNATGLVIVGIPAENRI